jgi:hypothetical protein
MPSLGLYHAQFLFQYTVSALSFPGSLDQAFLLHFLLAPTFAGGFAILLQVYSPR